MKRIMIASLAMLIAFAAAGTWSQKARAEQKASAATAKPVAKAVEKKPTLERADLYMVGSSCAACLMRIESKLNQAPGVMKAAVSIFNPYRAIIIYDSNKTSLTKIRAAISAEPAKFDRVVEHPIDKVPAVLMPPSGNSEGQSLH